MNAITRVRSLVGTIALASVLVACSSAAVVTPPPTASASAITPASVLPATASPVTSPSPTPGPTASPTPAVDCVFSPAKGTPPSDRLVDVQVSSTADADLVTFVFGKASVPANPAGKPTYHLIIAKKPYTNAASGKKIAMVGQRVLDIRFNHMSLQSDTTQDTYDGPTVFTSAGPAFRHAVEYDYFEGHENWYLGYDGNGCATLTRSGQNLVLAFAHG